MKVCAFRFQGGALGFCHDARYMLSGGEEETSRFLPFYRCRPKLLLDCVTHHQRDVCFGLAIARIMQWT